MSFDDECRKQCEAALAGDFARLLKEQYASGITFKQFLNNTSNKIMATAPMVEDVVWQLSQSKEFEIRCPSGSPKRSARFADDDIIMPRQQFFLPGVEIPAARNPKIKGRLGRSR